MAEREGFEPSVGVNLHTLSRRAPSANSATSPFYIILLSTSTNKSMFLYPTKANQKPSMLLSNLPPPLQVGVAEGVGFEPTVLSYNGFQDRRLKPLGHPS